MGHLPSKDFTAHLLSSMGTGRKYYYRGILANGETGMQSTGELLNTSHRVGIRREGSYSTRCCDLHLGDA